MSKNERLETLHDSRLIIDKTTDEVVVDKRTTDDLREDWLDPLRSVRRGLESTFVTSSDAAWIEEQNKKMAEKDPRIKQALDSRKS